MKSCHYCGGRGPFTRDHVVPRSRGGSEESWNIVRACGPCNVAKGNGWSYCGCDFCMTSKRKHAERWAITETNAGVGWVRPVPR